MNDPRVKMLLRRTVERALERRQAEAEVAGIEERGDADGRAHGKVGAYDARISRSKGIQTIAIPTIISSLQMNVLHDVQVH